MGTNVIIVQALDPHQLFWMRKDAASTEFCNNQAYISVITVVVVVVVVVVVGISVITAVIVAFCGVVS